MVDDVQVKDGVDQDTVDAVKSLSGTYKYGWDTEIEMEYASHPSSRVSQNTMCWATAFRPAPQK